MPKSSRTLAEISQRNLIQSNHCVISGDEMNDLTEIYTKCATTGEELPPELANRQPIEFVYD